MNKNKLHILLDIGLFDEKRFLEYITLFNRAEISTYSLSKKEIHQYDDGKNPIFYSQTLIQLITNDDSLYIPDNFVEALTSCINEVENYVLLDFMDYPLDKINLSTEEKIDFLIKIGSPRERKVLRKYREKRDLIWLIEEYYQCSPLDD